MIEDAMIIAGDSYREATRRKGVVFLLLLIAVAQVAVFSLYEEISLGVSDKMLMDSGLAMVTLVGIMSSMGVVFQVPKELRDRTASVRPRTGEEKTVSMIEIKAHLRVYQFFQNHKS